jgi:hypothetical protein
MSLRILSVAILAYSVLSASNPPKTLDASDARRLVLAALSKETKELPGLGVVPGRTENARCMTLDVLWANPGVGSAHVAFYIVDLRTAAIWTGVTGVLSLVATPPVVGLQRQLRRRVGSSDADYREAAEKHACGY